MKYLSNILAIIAIIFAAFVQYTVYTDIILPYKSKQKYFYKEGVYTNKNYDYNDSNGQSARYDTVPIFQKPDMYAKVIGYINVDTVFEAQSIESLPENDPLRKVENADYWYILPDNKGYVCEREIVPKQEIQNGNSKKKKGKQQLELGSHSLFHREYTTHGKILAAFFQGNSIYILSGCALLMVLLLYLLHPRSRAKGDAITAPLSPREYNILTCTIPLSLIACSLMILYIIVGIKETDMGTSLWYINPWRLGWWVLLTGPVISILVILNTMLFATDANYLSRIIKYKGDKWYNRIFVILAILLYYPIGIIGAITTFIFGLIGLVLIYTAFNMIKEAPKEFVKAAAESSRKTNDALSPQGPYYGVELSDGSKVRLQNVFGNMYKDDAGHEYVKSQDGEYTRIS